MSEDHYLDSEILGSLRVFLELYPSLRQLTGPIAQYKIVLDANAAVRDLIRKYEYPNLHQTALEEAARSGALEVYAPRWLDEEMLGSAIPQVATRRGIPGPELFALWSEYKKLIIWDDTFSVAAEDEAGEGDPKDLPYVALQQHIAAAAILSADKDIDALGGKRVNLEFILSVRTYARAASYAVGIRVGGTFIGTVSVALLWQVAKVVGSCLSRLPHWAKFAFLAVAVFIVVHPQSRERALKLLESLGERLADLWPELEKLSQLANEKRVEAEAALDKSKTLLDS